MGNQLSRKEDYAPINRCNSAKFCRALFVFKNSLKIPKGGNHNPYIDEERTTQWPKEKVQKDKQRSTKNTYKTKDRVTRTPLNTGGELMCSGRVNSFCSTSVTRRVNLDTNPVICQIFETRGDCSFC